ncbi:MAG TPA: glycosyltransferase [Steroidobacteraceae bacterium]|nr:glycosyltransferase [Steroidobacteraceae bacterium]
MTVSVCIATYRRAEPLRALLADLAAQEVHPFEVVIVDNDAAGSARAIVDERRQLGMPCPLIYDIQPRQNISLTRNRTVELAQGAWLAFIDDDERAPPEWLRQLRDAVSLHDADGVLGPVIPIVPNSAPQWIRRGQFYDWERLTTGAAVPRNRLRFGNLILRNSWVRRYPLPFDPAYGLTGGEDGDLLARMVNSGARIVWCDEAIVNEPIVPARLSLRWLLRRALRGGQDFARHTLAGRYGRIGLFERAGFVARAIAQSLAAALFAAVSFLRGRHASAFWLLKAAANIGKLTVFFGWHYREYAAPQENPST